MNNLFTILITIVCFVWVFIFLFLLIRDEYYFTPMQAAIRAGVSTILLFLLLMVIFVKGVHHEAKQNKTINCEHTDSRQRLELPFPNKRWWGA